MRRRRRYKLFKNIEIIDIGAEGKAIAKVQVGDKDEKMVVFVPNAVPGDVVDIKTYKKKRNYYEGRAVAFHNYSNERIEPFCEHFGLCGGCKWQQLPYEKQLFYKQKQVTDNFERIGKLHAGEILPILPSEKTKYYRNKLEYTFTDFRWLTDEELNKDNDQKELNGLGFHIPNRFDKILDIKNCYLQPNPSNDIRLAVKDFAQKHGMSFYNLRKHTGFLRNLIIRTTSTDEVMVILSIAYDDTEARQKMLNFIAREFPKIRSLMYVVNPKMNDTITDLNIELYKGRNYIVEKMNGLQFRIGPKSFYQTNSEQAFQLYRTARHFAQLEGNEIVYDLYTGIGTIANFLAVKAKKVIGIEFIPEAIIDAKTNSDINRIKNTEFFSGDTKDILTNEFIKQHGKPDVVVVDPPRAGMHKNVIRTLLSANPKRIVYVSCNPATQARDINMLAEKYTLEKMQPVDMFPHTQHVENVALLTRKEPDK